VATYTPPDIGTRPPGAGDGYDTLDSGSGWLVFAAVMLFMLGTVNFIQGIAAIDNAHFFVHNTSYVIGSLNTWGWIALGVGALQVLVAIGILVRNQFARWTGVGLLAIAAIVELLMMPAYPLWSLSLFAANIFALYGLAAHGDREW
jgi:hypothetical protein